jgi:hypothetical protein
MPRTLHEAFWLFHINGSKCKSKIPAIARFAYLPAYKQAFGVKRKSRVHGISLTAPGKKSLENYPAPAGCENCSLQPARLPVVKIVLYNRPACRL